MSVANPESEEETEPPFALLDRVWVLADFSPAMKLVGWHEDPQAVGLGFQKIKKNLIERGAQTLSNSGGQLAIVVKQGAACPSTAFPS